MMWAMDRRGFLKLFSAAVIVAPVAPKYFFAPRGGWFTATELAWQPWQMDRFHRIIVNARVVHGIYPIGASLLQREADEAALRRWYADLGAFGTARAELRPA
jgi:hypothetical protein